jgi:predicted Fe-Mo cluster-binding NifX family protein
LKIIISAQEPAFDGRVDQRFGRSPWLIFTDTNTGQWEALENPGGGQSGGAGVAAAQFVIDRQAEAVISGDFGPHAANALRAAKIDMYLFPAEIPSVQAAVEACVSGKLALFV